MSKIFFLGGHSYGRAKTTLLTLIGALRSTQEGSMKVLGNELRHAPKSLLVELRRNIGYIFQAHNLLNSLTARQNVQMSMELHNGLSESDRREKACAMLASVGLGEFVNYYPNELSVGQKQRVAIARALVSEPKIILADEPTASLDKKSGRDVVDIMQSLAKKQGSSVVMVTHDNRILDVADRLLRMEDGKLSTMDLAAV
ncbi:MAG TPA: ATP-binding cassette domain-containing protein [Leptolyngbyaceae cyanobacterium M33_DOE_097]|uniref:ATP-binding cassette domain-containing protein n=1 Tax=Oscillatoriales cyanobacterium SpSt-418 TaxID=2282169 RepID=A0A7C3KJ48_9CYAN|nr:ATP-binding cassette domain-containing protein [Leptolyngbyaceae cyanobacterium M33_DOE_097]